LTIIFNVVSLHQQTQTDMKTEYNETIIKAYNNYSTLLAKNKDGIEHLYGNEYQKRQRNINRITDNFIKVCNLEGFNATQVAIDLTKF